MKLSVACNFDDALLPGLRGYPVYEMTEEQWQKLDQLG